jgi:hypothetical protein
VKPPPRKIGKVLQSIGYNRQTAYGGQAAISLVKNLSTIPHTAALSRNDEAMNRNRNRPLRKTHPPFRRVGFLHRKGRP